MNWILIKISKLHQSNSSMIITQYLRYKTSFNLDFKTELYHSNPIKKSLKKKKLDQIIQFKVQVLEVLNEQN